MDVSDSRGRRKDVHGRPSPCSNPFGVTCRYLFQPLIARGLRDSRGFRLRCKVIRAGNLLKMLEGMLRRFP